MAPEQGSLLSLAGAAAISAAESWGTAWGWSCQPQEPGCCLQPHPSCFLQPHAANPRAVTSGPCSLSRWMPLARDRLNSGPQSVWPGCQHPACLPACWDAHPAGRGDWKLSVVVQRVMPSQAVGAGTPMHKALNCSCCSACRTSELWHGSFWLVEGQKTDPGA